MTIYIRPFATTWRSGPPPAIGWWPASSLKDPDLLRFWNGSWSLAVHCSATAEEAATACRKGVAAEINQIEWTDRWWPDPEAPWHAALGPGWEARGENEVRPLERPVLGRVRRHDHGGFFATLWLAGCTFVATSTAAEGPAIAWIRAKNRAAHKLQSCLDQLRQLPGGGPAL